MNPKYPVYIVSKGRWQFSNRLTSRTLEAIGVPYWIAVEPQEYDNYAEVIDPKKILVNKCCLNLNIGQNEQNGQNMTKLGPEDV